MNRPSRSAEPRPLSRELSVSLVQLSIALHKKISYPAGHPLERSAVEAVTLRITSLLRQLGQIEMAVARNQLVVAGAATDADNPVLRDLAGRLHRHQLGVVRFREGLSADELGTLLTAFAVEPRRDGTPLGLASPEERERWPHVDLEPLPFDQLEIADAPDDPNAPDRGGRSRQLWLALAAAALAEPLTEEDARLDDPEALAQAIRERRGNVSYDRVIVEYLMQLSRELHEARAPSPTGRQLTQLLQALQPETVRLLLTTGANLAERQKLVADAARSLPVSAVLELVNAAAAASKQDLSHTLLRVLTKLAAQSEEAGPVGQDAEAAVRDAVRQLLHDWTLDDPNPERYRHFLELIAPPMQAEVGEATFAESEARRLLLMSLEMGVFGDATGRAVDEMLERGEADMLLAAMAEAAEPSHRDPIWRHLETSDVLSRVLAREEQDPAALDQILAHLGDRAAEAMLIALSEAESIPVRRRLLARLKSLGTAIGPLILKRLQGAPWYVQRNLLSLLGQMERWPQEFTPEEYLGHEDGRVRREACKLMLTVPEHRARTVRVALSDTDPLVLQLGIGAAAENCPPAVAPRLVALLARKDLDDDLRLQAIRALGQVPSTMVRDWLVAHSLTTTRWWRRPRLLPKSPELLTILRVIGARWSGDPAMAPVLRRVAAADDAELRQALSGQGGPS